MTSTLKYLCLTALYLVSAGALKDKFIFSDGQHASLQMCEMKVKYKVNKIRDYNERTDINVNIELIVNPKDKTIRIITISQKKGQPDSLAKRKDFTTILSKLECNLEDGLESGEARYSGYIPQDDGSKEPAFYYFKVQKKAISIVTGQTEESKIPRFAMIVDKWEVIPSE